MAQNREAPAFQEYAASLMARTEYRVMSLEGRGLLMSLRLECWVNGTLPSDPLRLAKVLGFTPEQVERALPEVAGFFFVDAGSLRCPELDDYRAHINERSQKQSIGGKNGAAKTNAGRNSPATTGPTATPQLACDSLVKQSPAQSSTGKSLDGNGVNGEWLSDYERASGGH
jgi:hypothetical protein